MKKIGVVSKCEYYVPRIDKLSEINKLYYTKLSEINKLYYNNSSKFLYIRSLEIGIIDENDGELKLVSPSIYTNPASYNLGDLVEYDDEGDLVVGPKLFSLHKKDYSEKEINEITTLFEKYVQKFIDAKSSNNDSDAKKMESILRSLDACLKFISFMQNGNNNGLKR